MSAGSHGGRHSDVRMKGFRQRTDVADVLALLDDAVQPLAVEPVPVGACAGRVLATDVEATLDVPGFDRSAMDGYAVIAGETFGARENDPVPLAMVGESFPARPFAGRVEPGQTVQVMTGAALPDGADAVVPAEIVRRVADTVLILDAIPPGKHVSRRGEDVKSGDPLLASGRCLRPQDAGLLASLGVSPVEVIRRPRVDIVATGDELLPTGSRPHGTRIVDSNSVVLAALARRDGASVAPSARLKDDADLLRAHLQESTADVILISGGSSVGLEDHAPQVVADLGRLAVHGIAMRPSSPTGIGFLRLAAGERPIFLLPGNPVSCLCAYDFFAGRTIRRLGGRPTDWPYPRRRLPLAGKIVSQVGRVDYLRVQVVEGRVEPMTVGGAAIQSSTVRADGFVIIDRDAEGHAPGEEVDVHLYDARVP
ncbi:MAG: gephyrin-like molybdotransferase Glp [Acidobacteriota bacterium]